MAGKRSVVAERISAQGLAGEPLRTVAAVPELLLAVQGQDPRGARLAVRARTEGLSAADVDRAFAAGEIVVTWLNRGTLHLVRSEDYPLLQALTTPPLATGCARRLGQEGVSEAAAEKGLRTIRRALADAGALRRAELKERLERAGVPVAGQAFIHLMFLAALRGLVVRGPVLGGEQAYVLVEDRLGPQRPPRDRGAALAELARRYLAGHGPASDRDLARWAGLPLRDARAGLEAIAPQLRQRPDGLLDLAAAERATKLPPPRLLGAFDPLLLGWTSREEIVGPHKMLVTNNGIFRPFALVGGRAVSTWRYAGGKVKIEHLGKVSKRAAAALERDARAVEEFLAATGEAEG